MNVALFILIMIAIVILFNLYIRFLYKLQTKSISKKIEKGKFSDKKLIQLYHNSDKYRNNTVIAVIMMGIFYKYYLNLHENFYQLYKEEMIRRGLPT